MSKKIAKKLIEEQKPDFKKLSFVKEYEGYKIYTWVIGEIWESLCIIKNEPYHIVNVFYLPKEAREKGQYYVKEEFDRYLSLMFSMSMATIDVVALGKEPKKTKETEILGV